MGNPLVNPRHACARVTVLGRCVCVCVCVCVCPAPRVQPLRATERPTDTASAQAGKHFKYGIFSENASFKSYGVIYSRSQKNVSRIVHLFVIPFNLRGETRYHFYETNWKMPFYKSFTDVLLLYRAISK